MSLKRNLAEMENNNILVNEIPYNPQTNVWDLTGFRSILDSITPRTKTPAQLALEAIIEKNKKVKTNYTPVVLNPNAPEFVPNEIINFSNNNNVDFFEPPAIVRKQGIKEIGKEDLDSVRKVLSYDEHHENIIQIDNQNMEQLKSGSKFCCYDENHGIVSKVVVWVRSSGNELLEIVRFDKSWPSFKNDRRSFKSFQEWDEFVDELTKPKEKEQQQSSSNTVINWNDFEFIATTEDDDGFIININNPLECCMDNFEDGTFLNCFYKGKLVSQVKFCEGYKLNHSLVEKRRLNKSSNKLKFDSIQEWRDFVASSLV